MDKTQKQIEEYKEFIENMAINITPLSSTIGLISAIPIPFNVNTSRFIETCTQAMQNASNFGLKYIILDMANLKNVRSVQNIPAFKSVIDGFNLLGIEVVISGIHPNVALAAIQAGVTLKNVQMFGNVSDVLKALYK